MLARRSTAAGPILALVAMGFVCGLLISRGEWLIPIGLLAVVGIALASVLPERALLSLLRGCSTPPTAAWNHRRCAEDSACRGRRSAAFRVAFLLRATSMSRWPAIRARHLGGLYQSG